MLNLCKEISHGTVLVNLHSCVVLSLCPLCLGREVLISQQKDILVTINWLHAHMESKGCCKNISLHFSPECSGTVVCTTSTTVIFFSLSSSLHVPLVFSLSMPLFWKPTAMLFSDDDGNDWLRTFRFFSKWNV